jgi:hypothetical protein
MQRVPRRLVSRPLPGLWITILGGVLLALDLLAAG